MRSTNGHISGYRAFPEVIILNNGRQYVSRGPGTPKGKSNICIYVYIYWVLRGLGGSPGYDIYIYTYIHIYKCVHIHILYMYTSVATGPCAVATEHCSVATELLLRGRWQMSCAPKMWFCEQKTLFCVLRRAFFPTWIGFKGIATLGTLVDLLFTSYHLLFAPY